jgi:hypothetical protein
MRTWNHIRFQFKSCYTDRRIVQTCILHVFVFDATGVLEEHTAERVHLLSTQWNRLLPVVPQLSPFLHHDANGSPWTRYVTKIYLNWKKRKNWGFSYNGRESQWRSGSASDSNAKSLGFAAQFRDKNFRVRMRRPNYLGLVTLMSFGWDDKPRSSVCTHSEHQACTIKILQSLCGSHKIVETYRKKSMHSVSCLIPASNAQFWDLGG